MGEGVAVASRGAESGVARRAGGVVMGPVTITLPGPTVAYAVEPARLVAHHTEQP